MHIPVLLEEIKEALNLKEGGVLLDATLGNGGHSKEIVLSSKKPMVIIGLDEDTNAIQRATATLSKTNAKLVLKKTNFRRLDDVLKEAGISFLDGAVFDLGFSSEQLETPEGLSGRGFSFQKDEPLIMTLNDKPDKETLTAEYIVNQFEEKNLETIIRNYGEEKRAKKIAQAIVEARNKKKIKTSTELADIVSRALGKKRGKIHPATKTFQALRIAVNDELGALEEVLPKAVGHLKSGGRIAIISFHSLEDRIVKNFGKQYQKSGKIKIISKKPIIATRDEVKENPRARSAKLRIFEKI